LGLFVKGFNKWVKGRILLEPVVIHNRSILPTLNDACFAGFILTFFYISYDI
jgi:hypothetical protein